MVLKNYIKKYGDGGKAKGWERREQAYNFFVTRGYTKEQALGVVGNLMVESFSDLQTKVLGDNDTALGIAQWRGSRQRMLKSVRKDDWYTLNGQLEFIDWELKNEETTAYKKLLETSTPREAALAFSRWYERPNSDWKINHNQRRIDNTKVVGSEVGYYKREDDTIEERYSTAKVKDNTEVKTQKVKPLDYTTPIREDYEQPEYSVSSSPEEQNPFDFFKFDDVRDIEQEDIDLHNKAMDELKVHASTQAKEEDTDNSIRYQETIKGFDPYNYINIETFQRGGVKRDNTAVRTKRYIEPKVLKYEEDIIKDNIYKYRKSNKNIYPQDRGYRSIIFTDFEADEPDNRRVRDDIPTSDVVSDNILKYSSQNLVEPEKIKFEKDSYYEKASGEEIEELQKHLVEKGSLKVKTSNPKNEEETIRVQRMLLSEGYDLGEYGVNEDGVDGKFGKKTKKALEEYNKGLTTVDGKFGKKTKKALKERRDIEERYFDFKDERDIVKYQNNLEGQGYFKGIDYEPATTEDLVTRVNIKPNENVGIFEEIKSFFSTDEAEGREAPSCSFDAIPGSKSNDSRCTAFVGNEIEKAVGEKGRISAGAYGDAWNIANNMIKAGGREVYSIYEDKKPKLKASEIEPYIKERVKEYSSGLKPNMFAEGDVLNLFYEGSTFKEEAYKDSRGKHFTTHTGIIKKDKKGNLVVEHNVNGRVSREPLQRMIDNKVKHSGKDISITSIIRPNYSEEYYDSTDAQINEENVKNYGDLGSENAAIFTQTILKNKEALLKDIPINNSEFSKLTKAIKTIGWRETDFSDFNVVQSVKNIGANIRESIGGTERSQGVTRLKDEMNLTDTLRSKYIKGTGENLHNPIESGIPSFYALSSRYLYLKDLKNENNLQFTEDELVKLSMLGWNEKINIVGDSMKKYKTYGDVMNAYRTNKKTGEVSGHGYDLAFEAYNNYLK